MRLEVDGGGEENAYRLSPLSPTVSLGVIYRGIAGVSWLLFRGAAEGAVCVSTNEKRLKRATRQSFPGGDAEAYGAQTKLDTPPHHTERDKKYQLKILLES